MALRSFGATSTHNYPSHQLSYHLRKYEIHVCVYTYSSKHGVNLSRANTGLENSKYQEMFSEKLLGIRHSGISVVEVRYLH